jgi:hypothetical protein
MFVGDFVGNGAPTPGRLSGVETAPGHAHDRCIVCGTPDPRNHDTLCIRALQDWEVEALGLR